MAFKVSSNIGKSVIRIGDDIYVVDPKLANSFTHTNWVREDGLMYANPGTGSELLSNPEFTTDLTDWLVGNGALLSRVDFSSLGIAPSGGINEFGLSVESPGVASYGYHNYTQSSSTRIWFRTSFLAYGEAGSVSLEGVNTRGIIRTNTLSNQWEELKTIGRGTSTTGRVRVWNNTIDSTIYADRASAKALTTSHLFALMLGGVNRDSVGVTLSVLDQPAGVVGYADVSSNPQYYMTAFHNGTHIIMQRTVNGVSTYLKEIASTFVPNARIEMRRVSTVGDEITLQLWYDGVQIGVDEAINYSQIANGTYYGMFSTDAANKFTSFLLDDKFIPVGL